MALKYTIIVHRCVCSIRVVMYVFLISAVHIYDIWSIAELRFAVQIL